MSLASDYADSMRKSIEEVMTALHDGAEIEDQEASEYLSDWPLEIVNQRGRRFEVVLTVGGPDARVECDLDSAGERMGEAVLEVHWGSDSARRYGESVNALADYFTEMFNFD